MGQFSRHHTSVPVRDGVRLPVRPLGLLLAVGILVASGALRRDVAAQAGTELWTTPVNLSKSGGASQAVVTVAPDGRLHALWWDSADGEKYARTATATGSNWTTPLAVAQIYGQRQVVTDSGTGGTRLELQPPLELHMVSDSGGLVYALWWDSENQLSSAQVQDGDWGPATVLADAAIGAAAAADTGGTVRLVYVRSESGPAGPAGVYYRATSGEGWTVPVLVYASPYFRTLKPEQVVVSVAGNGTGQVVVGWDDPGLARSVYVVSTDRGRTWSRPQNVGNGPANPYLYGYITSAPNRDFVLLGRDTTAAGCSLNMWRSTDGGRTWDGPSFVSADFSHCPQQMRFSTGSDGRLWLLGLPPLEGADAAGDVAALAAWDGRAWSSPGEVSLSFQDKTTGREVSLSNLDLALAGPSVGIVGTDAAGDVWAVRNALTLDLLTPAFKPEWELPEPVSDQRTLDQVKDVPVIAADQQGKVYVAWSDAPALSEPGQALHIAVWDNGRWSRAVQMLQPAGSAGSASTGSPSGEIAEQPALAIDSQSRLHALWRGGTTAEILHSWAFAGDALSPSRWSAPVALPMTGQPASWPDLAVDPDSDVLHAVYAVPYNERRGIYSVQSTDGGTTWSSPTTVFDAAAARQDSVDKPRLILDAKTSILHAVWLDTTLVGEPLGQAVSYARSLDGGQTWSAPVTLTVGVSDWPRLAVAGAGRIYVVWNRPAVGAGAASSNPEVWGLFSPDSGQRWTEPKRIAGMEVSSPVGLVADGAGGLHLIGVGQDSTGEAALLYSHWDGQAWGSVELSGLGQAATADNGATALMVPASQRLAAVVRESVKQSDGRGQFRVIATGREIQAIGPPQPIATFTPLPSPTPTLTPIPLPTATPVPALNSTAAPTVTGTSPLQISRPLVIGGVAIILLIIGVVVSSVFRVARR